MKSKGIRILLLIIIFLITILVLNSNSIIKNTVQVQKEMSETMQVGDLNNQIDTLNTEHDAYKKYIAESKAQIASAITDMGVTTSNEVTLETMANNIRNIPVSSGIKSITIPSLTLSGSLTAFTSNSTQENCGAKCSNTNNVKIDCEGFSILSIGSTTKTISVTLGNIDGTTTTVNYSEPIDISLCSYITLSIPSSGNISSGYRNSTTIKYSVTVTDIVLM